MSALNLPTSALGEVITSGPHAGKLFGALSLAELGDLGKGRMSSDPAMCSLKLVARLVVLRRAQAAAPQIHSAALPSDQSSLRAPRGRRVVGEDVALHYGIRGLVRSSRPWWRVRSREDKSDHDRVCR